MEESKGISPSKLAFNKLKKNRMALFSFSVILVVILVAVLGPFIRPDHAPDANSQLLSISRKKPGFKAQLLADKKNEAYITPSIFSRLLDGGWNNCSHYTPVKEVTFRNDSIVYLAEGEEEFESIHVIDALFHLKGELKKVENTYEFEHFIDGELTKTKLKKSELSVLYGQVIISKTYALGTDKYGRDYLSRLMAGSAISISVGLIAVFISLLIGITLGLIAGFFRGKTDDFIMWFINVIWSIPTLLMVMAITLVFGKGFWKVFLAVGLTMWVEVARIVRGQVIAERELDYVTAAKSLGFSNLRIMFKHILPNIFSPIIVVTAANFAAAILIEAGLSFLGIGAQVPTPSWGNMIKEHYAYITTDFAYLALLPGVCIMVLVLAFMLLGNALRDALDVRG